MFLDNIFPPIPSEIIMPSGLYQPKGDLTLVGVIIAEAQDHWSRRWYWIGRKIPEQHLFIFYKTLRQIP